MSRLHLLFYSLLSLFLGYKLFLWGIWMSLRQNRLVLLHQSFHYTKTLESILTISLLLRLRLCGRFPLFGRKEEPRHLQVSSWNACISKMQQERPVLLVQHHTDKYPRYFLKAIFQSLFPSILSNYFLQFRFMSGLQFYISIRQNLVIFYLSKFHSTLVHYISMVS